MSRDGARASCPTLNRHFAGSGGVTHVSETFSVVKVSEDGEVISASNGKDYVARFCERVKKKGGSR